MPTNDKINVFDTRGDVAIGIDLPMFNDYGSRFKQTYITLDQASANARNLILTRQGERIMQPNFGCGLYSALFEQITEDLIDTLKLRIKEQFEYWLPYIFINTLEVAGASEYEKNTLQIYMVISLQNNKFDTKTITLELVNNEI